MQDSFCPELPRLRDFLAGRLSIEALRPVEDHLAICPRCLAAMADLKSDDELLAFLSVAPKCLEEGPATAASFLGRLLPLASDRPRTPSGCPEPTTDVLPANDAPTASWSGRATGELPRSRDAPIDFLRPPADADEIGQLGPYRILRVVCRGGMGIVFAGFDPRLHRHVAVKVLAHAASATQSERRRFQREARAAAALRNDHIVPLYDIGEDNNVLYLVMPLLDGEPLSARLARVRKLPPASAIAIAFEIARGLAAAHEQGLVHRDIKPGNIWLETLATNSSDLETTLPERVRILDFGLARILPGESSYFHRGEIAGTPGYLAPEQVEGRTVDPRTDLFSLGCVLYQMLTGNPPFVGENMDDMLRTVLHDHPPNIRNLDPSIPAGLSDLVDQLLSKSPEGRPASSAAVAAILASMLNEPLPLPNRANFESSTLSSRSRSVRMAIALFVAAAILSVVAVSHFWSNVPGRIRVEGRRSDVHFRITQNGQVVAESTAGHEIALPNGDYRLEVLSGAAQPILSLNITVTSGSRLQVTIP